METRGRLHQILPQPSLGSMPLPWIFLCFSVGILYGSWNWSDSGSNSASVEQRPVAAHRTAVASRVSGHHSQVVVRIGISPSRARGPGTAGAQALNSGPLFQQVWLYTPHPEQEALSPSAMRASVSFTRITTSCLLMVLQPGQGSAEWCLCWPHLASFMHSCLSSGGLVGVENPGWLSSHTKHRGWDGWTSRTWPDLSFSVGSLHQGG